MMEIGMVTAIAAAAMFFWYRPRWGEGAKLCALCFVMGLAGMFMGGCGPLLTMLEGLLAMVAGVCCLFSLHREKLARLRAQKRRAHQKAQPVPAQQPAPAQADRAAASDRAPLLTVLYGGEPRGCGCA